MTLVRLALRASRAGVLAATAVAALNGVLQALGYAQLAGDTEAERQAFAQQMALLGAQLSYLVPAPVELDTLAGYLQWRHFGNLPLVYAAWALISGTGATRGDEDRGLVETLVAAGASRVGYVAVRVATFAVLAALSVAVMLAATWAGSAAAGEPISAAALVQQGGAVWAIALACYAVALLAGQVAGSGRSAAGLGAIALGALFLVNSAARTGAGLAELRPLSPFYQYERSAPLLAGGSLDVAGFATLLAMAAALAAVAAVAFLRRDLGAGLVSFRPATGRPRRTAARDPLLRLPVLSLVAQQRLGLAVWALAIVVFGVFMLSIARAIVALASASPAMRALLERGGMTTEETFVATIWFGTLAFIVSLYAVAHVAGWASDERDGRLELELAAPLSRTRAVLTRAAALVVGLTVIAAAAAGVTLAATGWQGIHLDPLDVLRASALLVPVGLAFGAVGAAGLGWQPDLAVSALGTVAIASYFVQQLAPIFDVPEWVRNLSIYALYGQPLGGGISWERLGALLALAVVGLAVAVATMRRRDLAY